MATTKPVANRPEIETRIPEPPVPVNAVVQVPRTRSWWWMTTAGAAALVLGLGVAAGFWFLSRPLALLILGVSLASSLVPAVNFLEKRLHRVLAIALVFLALFILLFLIGLFVIPILVMQARNLVAATPNLVRQIESWLDQYGLLTGGPLPEAATAALGFLGEFLVRLPILIFSSLFDLLVVIFIAIYWLVVAPSMRRFFLSLFPPERHRDLDLLIEDAGAAMGGYVRGSAINGMVMAVLSYIGMALIGVPYPVVLAILTGVMELIPVLGPIIAGAIVVAFALSVSPAMALISLIFFVALQQAEGHILVPNIMRTQTNVSPLLAVLALLAGGTVGGLIGALIAIPVAGALTVVVRRVIAPAIRRQTGAAAIEVGVTKD